MGLNTYSSDYGSGSSMNSSTSWGIHDYVHEQERWQSFQAQAHLRPDRDVSTRKKASSFLDLVLGRVTLEDAMQEFRLNGCDSPYNPDDDTCATRRNDALSGLGPSTAYLRQKSCPAAPQRSPAVVKRQPRAWNQYDEIPQADPKPSAITAADGLTDEQRRVLQSLPDTAVYSLLREIEKARDTDYRELSRVPNECRFCKNNGERESYYKQHTLKDAFGRVRCPVLRAFVCPRCGASGDSAHTIKYCRLSTAEERVRSAAMMRSVQSASRRRRSLPPSDSYVYFGETSPSVIQDTNVFEMAPLDPLWAALERKLMM